MWSAETAPARSGPHNDAGLRVLGPYDDLELDPVAASPQPSGAFVQERPLADRLVLLGAPCPATNVLFHALADAFGPSTIVLEKRLSRRTLATRRAKMLGLPTVAGQVLFSAITVPVLQRRAANRIVEITEEHRLDVTPIDQPVIRVESVNSPECRALLRKLDPAVVVVSGSRIICQPTLQCTNALFVNLHAGVAPQYRGVHGGYWALAEGRPEMVGSTVHLVDKGIDTGPILQQATFAVTRADSFVTYPYLHLAAGVPLLIDAVKPLLAGDPPAIVRAISTEPSRLRTHPTLWGYLARRLRSAVA